MGLIVEVKHLSKQFGDIKAVEDLSFSVNEGDIYGFLGPNGAGKSTTIRMLLTLIKPGAGEIKIFGKDLSINRNEILKQTGAVIERPDLYEYLSAYDNLSIFARMSGTRISRKLLMDQLAMVGLTERYNSKVGTYSQGMKQRLGIAVALIHNPRVIILDEPTNGLDPQGIADMRNLVLQLSHQMGKTVIISSHLLSEIELVANRMLIVHKGKKVAEGLVKDMLDPANTIVEIETTDNAGAMIHLQETGWLLSNLGQPGKEIRLRMDKKQIPLLTNKLVTMGVGILSVNPRHSLEDYFLSLTNAENNVEPFKN